MSDADDWGTELDWDFLDEELDEALACSLENPDYCEACD